MLLFQTGFATKANALRHVQKQHKEVPDSDIETCIIHNLDADIGDDDSDIPSPSPSPAVSSTPPLAHSTPVGSHGPKPLPHAAGPLDFSVRNPELSSRLMFPIMPSAAMLPQSITALTSDTGDQPMDLSNKSKSLSSPSSSASSSACPTPSTPRKVSCVCVCV
jgi:hypothetical protein